MVEDQGSNAPLQPERSGWVQRLSTRWAVIIIGGVSLFFIIIALIGTVYFLSRKNVEGPTDVSPPVSLSDLAAEYPELSSVLQDPKLDSVYKEFLLAYNEGGPEAAYELAKKRGLLNANDELRLTLELDTTETSLLEQQLQEKGVKVTAVSGNLMDVAIPGEVLEQIVEAADAASFLEGITELEHVIRVRTPIPGEQYSVNGVDTESLGVINAPAWHAAGFTGKGIKIGVLDMSFDKYKELLGTELPDQVTVASFIAGVEADQTGDVHGTAVAEIIHDIAPDAELYFAAFQTDVEYQLATDWLVSQGVDIISNSTGSSVGSMDGTGSDAQMVDRIVDQGILWVISAGNSGDKHYRGTFTDTDGDGWHEFNSETEFLPFATAGVTKMTLNWDAWQQGDQNYDLYIYDEQKNEIVRSEYIQDGPGDWAAEFIINEFGEEPALYYAAFYAAQITRPGVFDFYTSGLVHPDFASPDHSLGTPADAFRALTVGATNWQTDALEEYSSQGPTNDGRLKPEISAPTDISSAAYGEVWDGTSASAPHVSAAAALVMQAFPTYSVDQVKEYLLNQAMDLGPSGPDNMFGYGRLWLSDPPAAVDLVPTPTVVQGVPFPEVTSIAPPTQEVIATWEPTATPDFSEADSEPGIGTTEWLILACITIPGCLGIGGIFLLVGLWFVMRSRAPSKPAQGGRAARPTPAARADAEGEIACPRCGSAVPANASFCTNCGLVMKAGASASAGSAGAAPVDSRCRNCGQPLRPNSKFCPRCGQPQ
jgi:subtilisin family serine protease